MRISSLFLYTSLLFSVCAIQIPEYSFVEPSQHIDSHQQRQNKEYFSHTDHHCIAYHYAIKYDGRGNIYIAGTERDLTIHTHKIQCGNVSQGWKKVVAFDNRDVRYIIIKTFGYLNGIRCGGYLTMDASVPDIHIFEKCHWTEPGLADKNAVHIPLIKMKVIATKYETTKIQHLRHRIRDLSNSTKVTIKKVDKSSKSSVSNFHIRKPHYNNFTQHIVVESKPIIIVTTSATPMPSSFQTHTTTSNSYGSKSSSTTVSSKTPESASSSSSSKTHESSSSKTHESSSSKTHESSSSKTHESSSSKTHESSSSVSISSSSSSSGSKAPEAISADKNEEKSASTFTTNKTDSISQSTSKTPEATSADTNEKKSESNTSSTKYVPAGTSDENVKKVTYTIPLTSIKQSTSKTPDRNSFENVSSNVPATTTATSVKDTSFATTHISVSAVSVKDTPLTTSPPLSAVSVKQTPLTTSPPVSSVSASSVKHTPLTTSLPVSSVSASSVKQTPFTTKPIQVSTSSVKDTPLTTSPHVSSVSSVSVKDTPLTTKPIQVSASSVKDTPLTTSPHVSSVSAVSVKQTPLTTSLPVSSVSSVSVKQTPLNTSPPVSSVSVKQTPLITSHPSYVSMKDVPLPTSNPSSNVSVKQTLLTTTTPIPSSSVSVKDTTPLTTTRTESVTTTPSTTPTIIDETTIEFIKTVNGQWYLTAETMEIANNPRPCRTITIFENENQLFFKLAMNEGNQTFSVIDKIITEYNHLSRTFVMDGLKYTYRTFHIDNKNYLYISDSKYEYLYCNEYSYDSLYEMTPALKAVVTKNKYNIILTEMYCYTD